jgi:taurine dioxygenase
MTLKVRKLSYALGAEINGVDLSRPIGEVEAGAMREAFLEHGLLLIRGQSITREQHLAFARVFGEADQNKLIKRNEVPGFSEISFVVSKPRPSGEPDAGYADGQFPGQDWHSDKSYVTVPAKATILRAVELPSVGGDTMFANGCLAYETLSDGMKKLLVGLEGVHDREGYKSVLLDQSTPDKAAQAKRITRTAQPLVRVHPETGRKALYLGETLVRQIVGMTAAESGPLLDYLKQHMTRPQYVYRHVWQKDDVLMWDNRCTMHVALGDFDRRNQLRHLEKITLVGTPSGYSYEGPVG